MEVLCAATGRGLTSHGHGQELMQSVVSPVTCSVVAWNSVPRSAWNSSSTSSGLSCTSWSSRVCDWCEHPPLASAPCKIVPPLPKQAGEGLAPC